MNASTTAPPLLQRLTASETSTARLPACRRSKNAGELLEIETASSSQALVLSLPRKTRAATIAALASTGAAPLSKALLPGHPCGDALRGCPGFQMQVLALAKHRIVGIDPGVTIPSSIVRYRRERTFVPSVTGTFTDRRTIVLTKTVDGIGSWQMRQSLLTPIPELDLAARLLDAAAEAILVDRTALAGQLIVQADFPEIMDYAKRLVGKMSLEVHRVTQRPTDDEKPTRDSTRMPTKAEQSAIFARDGWRCRFCGIKVICRSARSVLTRMFHIQAHWTSLEFQRHSALYAMASSLDHVVPHSRGGKNEASNFVTACYCCQFGRGEWKLNEVELMDPRDREPVVDSWDGLCRIAGLQPGSSLRATAQLDAGSERTVALD